MSFCSPTAANKSFCYSFDSLFKVALAWNYLKPNDKIMKLIFIVSYAMFIVAIWVLHKNTHK